jgi:PIN domain nuclease of toxin-antitoxin system
VDVRSVLLDTHAFVWAVSEPDRLSPRARDAVADRSTRLLVSAASVWEMAIKHHAGRWPEAEPFLSGYGDIVARLGGEHLPIGWEDARRAGGLRWDHTDPFDRMLAVQSMNTGAALVSRDLHFAELHGVELLW